MVYTKRVDMANHKDITFKFWAQNVLPIGFFQGTTLMLGCVKLASVERVERDVIARV
jgi:hypothetical protein